MSIAPEEVRRVIAALVPPLPPRPVPLSVAVGLVLAAPVVAGIDLPRFDASAMDGFAVRAADTPGRLRVVAQSLAGAPWGGPLQAGDAALIATGGAVPPGADAVVAVEDTAHQDDGTITVLAPVPLGRHIRQAGEDLAAGSVVLPAGLVLGAGQLAAAAAVGAATVTVHPRPRVAILPTGDEIRPPGSVLGPGEIYDALSAALACLVEAAGGVPVLAVAVPDEPAAVLAALRLAAAEADLVVTTGGVSVGERDVIARLGGGITTFRTGLRPARPFACGRVDGTPLIALPGNPGSALASFEEFCWPAIQGLLGKPVVPRAGVRAILTEPLSPSGSRPGELHLVRVTVWREERQLRVRSAGGQGAGTVHSLARANGWAAIRGAAAGGAEVEVRLIGEVWDSDPFGL